MNDTLPGHTKSYFSKDDMQTEMFKSVFLSPDRTLDQRTLLRERVTQLKDKVKQEPQKNTFYKRESNFQYRKTSQHSRT